MIATGAVAVLTVVCSRLAAMHKPRLAIPLDMTELLLEGSERRQRHTPLRLQEVELASFTLRDKDLFDRTSEKSAQLWDDVRF